MRALAQKHSRSHRASITRSGTKTVATNRVGHPILHLQRRIGNQAIQRLLHRDSEWHDVSQNLRDKSASSQVDVGFQRALESQAGNGRPLPPSARAFFEPRFGVSFQHVRMHDDHRAAALSSEINARAFTHGTHIYFAEGEHDVESAQGRRLLAHELTHTLQQQPSGSNDTTLSTRNLAAKRRQSSLLSPKMEIQIQRWEDVQTEGRLQSFRDRAGAEARLARLRERNPRSEYRIIEREGNFVIQSRTAGRAATRPQICNRDSTQVSGFPDPHISQIDIDLGNLRSGLHITWSRETTETRALNRDFPMSPGAGLCTTCCDDFAASRTPGSLCTPKGNFQVDGYRCQLSSTSWATSVTFFAANVRSGIAIHKGPLPGHPASHGCVRTSEQGSQIIQDNSRSGQTAVHVGGTWSGSHCYDNIHQPSARPRRTSERCGRATQEQTRQSERRFAEMLLPEEPIDGAGPA